jgi:hypothetical protein
LLPLPLTRKHAHPHSLTHSLTHTLTLITHSHIHYIIYTVVYTLFTLFILCDFSFSKKKRIAYTVGSTLAAVGVLLLLIRKKKLKTSLLMATIKKYMAPSFTCISMIMWFLKG